MYNMNHPRRRIAYIFNHETFDDEIKTRFSGRDLTRRGSFQDMERLEKVLFSLDFKVKCFSNLRLKELRKMIKKRNNF